jgi:hypothetical protein
MQLTDFYSATEGKIHFTRQQASAFAKGVAGDFNPIHNPDNKMFCVPGDLLFSVGLSKLGLSQKLRCRFTGMVGDGVLLHFHNCDSDACSIEDEEGKGYLTIERSGESTADRDVICSLAHRYVEFSGHTFPDILVPLMAETGVMMNPSRPLIIYESMEIDLTRLDIRDPRLELDRSTLQVEGKKGNVRLGFLLKDGDEVVGSGAKYMLVRGLRPYEADAMDKVVSGYMADKEAQVG